MKISKRILILSIIFVFGGWPLLAEMAPPTSLSTSLDIQPPTRWVNIQELIEQIINVLLVLSGIGLTLAIFYAAYLFLFAQGRPEKMRTAWKTIIWALVGLGIILFSRAIVAIIKTVLGGGTTS